MDNDSAAAKKIYLWVIIKELELELVITFLPLARSDVISGSEPSSETAAGCLFLMWYSIVTYI